MAIQFTGRTTRAALAAGLAGTVGVGVLLVSQAGSNAASTETQVNDTLRLDAKRVQERFVDQGASGPSVGDRYVFSENIYERGEKERIGRSLVACDLAYVSKNSRGKVTNGMMQCTGTLKFGDDAVTVQGPVSWNNRTSTLAVTGGTGRYDDAHGEFEVKDVSDTRSEYTLRVRDDNGGVLS